MVIHARFSSQPQNSRSIADRIAICRERAGREKWTVIDVFTDCAISDAAGIGEDQRPGLAAMPARVRQGGVDQLLAEATDRIARHQGDSHAIREQLEYCKTRLFTLSDGVVTEINRTFKGLMAAQFRKEPVPRAGVASAAQSPTGVRRPALPTATEQPIGSTTTDDPPAACATSTRSRRKSTAASSRKFASGLSARTIAARLNADAIPGPRGSHWRASTINGDGSRGHGVLSNEFYIGRLVRNRTSKVPEPVTRTVRIRPNPPADRIVSTVPHLRIVDDEVWEAVQERRRSYRGVKRHRTVGPRRMLSGLGVRELCNEG